MNLAVAGFDWDDGNRAKCQKHGVAIAEIEFLFGNGPRVAPDIRHSQSESRHLAVGRNAAGRYMFVAFTLRSSPQGLLIRPISARYMHQKEVAAYESQIAADEKR